MKRLLVLGAILLGAVTSIVLAQPAHQATLRTPSGERPVTYVQVGGHTFLNAVEVILGLGGTITPDSTGFRVMLNETTGVFGSESRFAVVRDDLIEMPVEPIMVEGRPFVPWQFFDGFLARAAQMEAQWDGVAHILTVRPRQQNAVAAQMSVTNFQGTSKIVVTLSSPAEYTITKEDNIYRITFRSPIQPPFVEQNFEDPHVSKATFGRNELRIQLTGLDVVGDPYRLDNPFRIVIDVRKGTVPVPVPSTGVPRPRSVDAPGIRTIVIDPGHGGKEVGAVGANGLMEKDVTLTVARKLASALESRIGARVILTREDDSIVSLDQRTAIANQYKADLFLSVHMNAAVVKGAKGSETYFLSLEATDDHARAAAETENAGAVVGGASDDLKLILWDLAQQEYLHESSRFASAVQEELNKATGVQNRGVKQAPFKVLVGATMPAALVEVGFISNPDEEAKLQTDAFQNMMVEALSRAVERYKQEYETRIGLIRPLGQAPPMAGEAKGRTGT
jgi:N-acetylmuramoyl-L-alanine amidase